MLHGHAIAKMTARFWNVVTTYYYYYYYYFYFILFFFYIEWFKFAVLVLKLSTFACWKILLCFELTVNVTTVLPIDELGRLTSSVWIMVFCVECLLWLKIC